MKEKWMPVVGYEGFYEVSDQGHVRALARVVRRCKCGEPISTLKPKPTKWSLHVAGYPVVSLSKNGRAKQQLVHRLVLEAFVGPCPSGMEACHENGVRTDPRLANLRWDTKKGNHADKWRHGTMLVGEQTNNAKLTTNEVREIKASKLQTSALAKHYRVGRNTIDRIRQGLTWKHVEAIKAP